MNRIKNYWDALDQDTVINRQKLILGLAACTLAGVVIGMFLAPPKSITVGSGNTINADSPVAEEDNAEENDTEEEAGE